MTGATAPYGVATVRGLLLRPEVEHILAVGAEPGPGRLARVLDERVEYMQADLTHAREVRTLLYGPVRERGIDTIVHGAHHRPPVHRRLERLIDVETTRTILHIVERHPTIRRLVFRSHADVYRVDAELPTLIAEDHPLELRGRLPQRVRDHVEADVMVCTRMGLAPVSIAVLRFAEIFGPDCGSQLWDYLGARVCFRALGFDPMLNLLSSEDAGTATVLAAASDAQGVFNVPGADTLPLTAAIDRSHRLCLSLPGPVLAPVYGLRRAASPAEFVFALNRDIFHFSAVLDGERARRVLGYAPNVHVTWPPPRRAASDGPPHLRHTSSV